MGCTWGAGLAEGRELLFPKEEEDGLLLQLLVEWELGPREEEEDRLLPKLEEWELEWEEKLECEEEEWEECELELCPLGIWIPPF